MGENMLQDEQPPARMVAGALAHLGRHMTTGCPHAAEQAALLLARLADDSEADPHLRAHARELVDVLERERADASNCQAELRRLSFELKTARAAEAFARTEVANLRERLTAYETGTAMVAMGRRLLALTAENEALRASAVRSKALEKVCSEAETRIARLERERDSLAAERAALERLLLAGDTETVSCDGACDGCENRVASRCVLCVGGRTALLPQYRALAERLGIRLIHHDGGQQDSLSRLPYLINGADAVLCPTDCVSHAAYYKLKQHCKRTGKPCLLFKGAGVSGFAVALARLAAGQISISGSEPIRH